MVLTYRYRLFHQASNERYQNHLRPRLGQGRKEGTAENKKTLVEACHKYLKGHPGVVFYSAGVLAEDLKRSVNDLNFDVALHLVFNDKASQDKYQDAPRHLEFIEKNKSLWKSVRVFDSYVSQ